MIIPLPYSPDSFDKYYRQFGADPQAAFIAISLVITKRFYEQNALRAPSDAYLSEMLKACWNVAHSEGLPQPLAASDSADAPDLDYDYHSKLVEGVLSSLPQHRTEDYLRILLGQLFATLLAREFKTCRRSYEETDASGACMRQSDDYCKDRISGTHCEDCPYFIALSPAQHTKFLQRFWKDEAGPTEGQLKVFLPHDFRALRIFWHLYIRTTT